MSSAESSFEFTSICMPVKVKDAIVLNSNVLISDFIDYINDNAITKIKIPAVFDLSFIQHCPTLKYFQVSIDNDFTPLYSHNEVLFLSLHDNTGYQKLCHEIDLERIQGLQSFSSSGFNKLIKNLNRAHGIRSLNLADYSDDHNSLEGLSGLQKIDTLYLIKSPISTLDGIEYLLGLKCLSINILHKLLKISSIGRLSRNLKLLRIEDCNKINDLNTLERLDQLLTLSLFGKCTIPDLAFIEKMKNLRNFSFNYNILDGDLSNCMKLDYVYVEPDRRHFSHRNDEMPKKHMICGNEEIPEWRRVT